MADAQWSVAVPTQTVDDSGTVQVQVDCTDAVTGDVTTFVLSVDPQRRAVVTASGAALADYRAWSTS